MIVIDKIVNAFLLEAENFQELQKKELQIIIKKIDTSAFPTEIEIKKNPACFLKFIKLKNKTQNIFSEYGKRYKDFGGNEDRLNKIIKENMNL